MVKLTVYFIFTAIFCLSSITAEEPVCSRFDYDKKIMEYITETRYQMKEMGKDLRRTEEYLLAVLERRKVEMGQIEDGIKHKLEQALLNITDKVKDLEEKVDYKTVAFSAYNPVDTSLQANEVLVLQSVHFNEGNAYDTKSGKFTAPTSGLYHFTAHVCNTHGLVIHYAIVKDGTWIARSQQFEQANENTNKDVSCSSVSALIMMQPKEQVWIMCTSGYPSSTKQVWEDKYRGNSFIGVLLQI